MNSHRNLGRLEHAELRAIDSSISMIQTLGNTSDANRDGNTRPQSAEARAEMNIRFVANLSERDRKIVGRIRALAAQLTARTSLRELENARGEVVRGHGVSDG